MPKVEMRKSAPASAPARPALPPIEPENAYGFRLLVAANRERAAARGAAATA